MAVMEYFFLSLGMHAYPVLSTHVEVSLPIPLGGRRMLQYFNCEDERGRDLKQISTILILTF